MARIELDGFTNSLPQNGDEFVVARSNNDTFNILWEKIKEAPISPQNGPDFSTNTEEFPLTLQGDPRTVDHDVSNPEEVGMGTALNMRGKDSDFRVYVQGGHGRIAIAWNAYWQDDDEFGNDDQPGWFSIVGGEPHTLLGIGNTSPGGSNGENIVLATAPDNFSAGDPIDWNVALKAEAGEVDLGKLMTSFDDPSQFAGREVRAASGPPSSTEGKNGDIYIQTD